MFGIGAGKIELNIPTTTYKRGDTLNGTLHLTVNQTIKARGLIVILYAEQKVREYEHGMGKHKEHYDEHTRRVHEIPIALDGEREYQKTDVPAVYPFTLTVPPLTDWEIALMNQPKPDLFTTVFRFFAPQTGPFGPQTWYIEGYLDLPMAFDISKKIQLTI